jgi:hypothetical protein
LRFGVIERDSVECNANSGGVTPSDAEVGVACAGTIFGETHYARCEVYGKGEQNGGGRLSQLFAIELGVGNRRSVTRGYSRDHDAVKVATLCL